MDYLANLEFNGTFYIIRLIDRIQQVQGVVDVVPAGFQVAPDSMALSSFSRIYNPISGYLTIHPDHLLEDVITYSAS